jgi:hypothetical protein
MEWPGIFVIKEIRYFYSGVKFVPFTRWRTVLSRQMNQWIMLTTSLSSSRKRESPFAVCDTMKRRMRGEG